MKPLIEPSIQPVERRTADLLIIVVSIHVRSQAVAVTKWKIGHEVEHQAVAQIEAAQRPGRGIVAFVTCESRRLHYFSMAARLL